MLLLLLVVLSRSLEDSHILFLLLFQPMSEKTKDYIRKLDIDADALLLKERLNICDEAIDYFRASSLILKKGVEAGLSLYQIAVMCCRNDDLAQEPSLLERLSVLAGELAQQVVDNDQWHHTPASRALVDQLTPSRGYLTPTGFKGRFHRSASSGEFRTLSSRDSSLSETKLGGSPLMAQSSGSSDSGNDSFVDGTVDQEDVEEWAHSILEDSFVHVHSTPPSRRNQRSSSIASDDASNDSCGSPKGFWRVRPGTPPDVMSDDGSVNWSPVVSSHTTIELGEEDPPLALEFQPIERRRSVQFSEAVEHVPRRDILDSSREFLLPPAMIEAPSNEPAQVSFNRQDSTDSSGMRRSKSYTAFSRTGSMDEEHPKLVQSAGPVGSATNKLNSVEDHEHMRLYFHKFTSLVIARELRRMVTENPEK